MAPPDHDPLPGLVLAFERGIDAGGPLLVEVRRHVARVARPYPDAWFALGRKGDEAVDDLGHRVFTTCARVPKGRFPFMGRTPFAAYVAEDFDGRAIRYHSFYARLSITRELMRADYAHNLASDPRLVWRADLYGEIGDNLRVLAQAQEGRPPRWALGGPALVRPEEAVVATLKAGRAREVRVLVEQALRAGGPRTQPELCRILEAVLGAPAAPEPAEEAVEAGISLEQAAVREAVRAGWAALGLAERQLLRALAAGLSYDEVCAEMPAFSHKVAVNRALERIGKVFVDRIVALVGGEAASAPPKALLEMVLEVLGTMELA